LKSTKRTPKGDSGFHGVCRLWARVPVFEANWPPSFLQLEKMASLLLEKWVLIANIVLPCGVSRNPG